MKANRQRFTRTRRIAYFVYRATAAPVIVSALAVAVVYVGGGV